MRIFEIVKENVNLREAAELYGIDVNRYGKALCPFHNDRHPSLYVADDHYYCFACGEHGDVIDFVGRLFQLSPYDAARKLMTDFHLSPDKPPSAAALHAKRIRTEAQQLMENERLCFSVLSDYARVLRDWKVRYAPQSPDAPVHARFVEACHKLDQTEYHLDMLTVRPLDEQGNWQYKTEKEYLCVRNGEERGFTAAEFKAAQADGWEKQYPYKVGRKKVYMPSSEADKHGYERANKHPKSTKFGRQNPIAERWNSEEQLIEWRKAWADVTLLRGQHQSRTEECAHTGRPTQGKYHAKEHGREETHLMAVYGLAAASEQIPFENTQKIQPKEDYHQSGNYIHHGLIFPQEAADGACQCAHCYKDYGKPTNKSQRPQQGLSCSAFSTARKIGDIDGKHREQAR